MSFDPCNCLLKIWASMRALIPKVGVHLGVWGVLSFTLSYILRSMKCESWASLLACTFTNPCLGCDPKARVATLLMDWHRVINWWHSHFGKCDDYWVNKLSLLNCFILQGDHDDGNPDTRRTLPRLTLNRHVFSPCHIGLELFTPTWRWLFPLMC
jgi:hypothetical protein